MCRNHDDPLKTVSVVSPYYSKSCMASHLIQNKNCALQTTLFSWVWILVSRHALISLKTFVWSIFMAKNTFSLESHVVGSFTYFSIFKCHIIQQAFLKTKLYKILIAILVHCVLFHLLDIIHALQLALSHFVIYILIFLMVFLVPASPYNRASVRKSILFCSLLHSQSLERWL